MGAGTCRAARLLGRTCGSGNRAGAGRSFYKKSGSALLAEAAQAGESFVVTFILFLCLKTCSFSEIVK